MATEWLQMYETIHGDSHAFVPVRETPRNTTTLFIMLHPPSSSSDPDMDDECGAEVTDLRPGMITRLPLAYPPRCVSVIRIEDDQPLTFGVRRAQDHLPASGRGLAVWRGHGLDKSWVNEELECLSWVFSGSWVVRL
ncbi:hypothetical protein SI65_08140 [Aspergillus cristatus]|uniref:Uncharacterized protein n=1 Tax=Aspergillus cristatus TaxID=573508 RepID=A0A1E3B6P9_ASPCR|nr:hypothetical protein SI65_08140 [Aspergillus cristatus]